jgi:hypothetical protein
MRLIRCEIKKGGEAFAMVVKREKAGDKNMWSRWGKGKE